MNETRITLGSDTMTVNTHPNAPVVINFYTVKGGQKRYNRNPRNMKYSSEKNAEWFKDTMNHLHGGFGDTVYYIASK